MLDLDMGESETKKLSVSDSKSTLAKPVKELITMIFDIESMKAAMLEFEIDLTKMPLGRLSKSQIKQAGIYIFFHLSPPSMNSLYTLGAAASIEAIESEQSCHFHSHSPPPQLGVTPNATMP